MPIFRLSAAFGTVLAAALMLSPATANARHHHAPHHAVAKQAAASRYGSIIVDASTGKVLSATNPDRSSYPASLTKVMTLFLLFDALDKGDIRLDTEMTVSARAASQAPSRLGLEPGDTIRVDDAIRALVTKSANDVAVVVSEALADSESDFAMEMTAKARQLGMSSTTYRNASGLPNPLQISTPRDQLTLARAMLRDHPRQYHYFNTREFVWRGQPIPSHNHFMLDYEGADGIKTGFINASGFNLVASAVRGGHRLIGVVFGGNTAHWRDTRMAELFDRGFARLNGGQELAQGDADEPEEEAAPSPKGHPTSMRELVARASSDEDVPAPRHPQHHTAKATAQGDDDVSVWGIQVGVYSQIKPARHAAATAARKLGGLIAKASIDIDSDETRKQKAIYRARLIGFSETQARAACKKLARARQECRVVQPEG